MSVAIDIANARAWLEKAEREHDPELKAHALEDGARECGLLRRSDFAAAMFGRAMA